jgi:Asp-tRNA(Asn)/Glu-tRNA(Gln) amidotransferase A subunit family amidase
VIAPPTDLAALSLSEASRLVRARAVSPVELTNACLERIERHQPALNAFIEVTAEAALERSGRAPPSARSPPAAGSGRCTGSRSRSRI